MRRMILGLLAALLMLSATACSVVQKDPNYTPPPPLPPLEQLKQATVVQPSQPPSEGEPLTFVTKDRNAVCAITESKGEHVNVPYEDNDFGNSANNKYPTVPVVQCEFAVYPQVKTSDVKDDCSGTGFGYLGGIITLAPTAVRYGNCRAGATAMENEFGPKGTRNGEISQLETLEDGTAVERNGLRCTVYNNGVACGNLSAGVGFFVSRTEYQLLAPDAKAGKTTKSSPSSTPVPTSK
ncbi:hypothetical protein ACQR35_06220 [Pseudarthrobacter sp. J1738]